MESLKSKSKLLIAFVLAAVLAMAGVSYALANPNNSEENAGVSTQTESSSSKNLKYRIIDKEIDGNMGRRTVNDTSEINENIFAARINGNETAFICYWEIDGEMPDDSCDCDEADIDLATLGMSEGDIITLDFCCMKEAPIRLVYILTLSKPTLMNQFLR